jgi:hypothetical protein
VPEGQVSRAGQWGIEECDAVMLLRESPQLSAELEAYRQLERLYLQILQRSWRVGIGMTIRT